MVSDEPKTLATRFRGFLPVVVDVETGGFNITQDALLEIGAVLLKFNLNGQLTIDKSIAFAVTPFVGSNINPESLAFTGINLDDPERVEIPETDAMREIFSEIRRAVKANGCRRAVLVGHNPSFDLSVVNAAAERCQLKRNPFHPFTTFDTATLAGLAYGQTVLARAAQLAGIEWQNREAHAARYDAEKTAELFCNIVNRWDSVYDVPVATFE